MRNVNDYLKQLGLSEIETKLYLGLLETGSTTVMELANHLGIKRITAHFNIESLIKKGLVTETRKGARRQIVAEDPDRLKQFLEEKEEEIQQLKKTLPGMIEIISKNIPKAKTVDDVEIRFYEGKKAVQGVYQETLKANEVYSFADLDKYYEVYPGTLEMWEQSLHTNPQRKVWDLLVDSPLSRKIGVEGGYERYYVKLLPKSDFFKDFGFSDYIIFDNKVAIIHLDNNNPTATVIESKEIALSLKALHRSMWQLLP